ncbi:MAG: transposase [Thaumarchaeota archaeon]|nr:transposase [Nitrososphaerota archaeon]
MQITRGYRTELDPSKTQVISFKRACGIARFAYNWGLERNNNVWLYNQLPHEPVEYEPAIDQHRLLNEHKQTDWPWMYEVSKCAPQEALRDLGNAFHNFLKRPDHFKWPNFKSKNDGVQSFTLTGAIKIRNDKIQLPSFGEVRLKEHGYLPANKHALYATVTRKAGRWFVSIGMRKRIKVPKNHGGVGGVDFNVRNNVVSDGTVFENVKNPAAKDRRLRRLQRAIGRKAKGSKNRWKARLASQRFNMRIADARNDGLHKTAAWLARAKSVVVIEDLAVQNLTKNHRLAGAILNGAPAELGRQLGYKTKWYGSKLVIAPRNFPSTKRCSGCGNVKAEMPLSERVYVCEVCGLVLDRDLNAAKNLEWHATVAGSPPETLNAFGRQEVAAKSAVPAVITGGSVHGLK